MRATAKKLEIQPKLILPGDLQLAVLGAVWKEKQVSFRQVRSFVYENYKPCAESTVSTTITRLIERGWVVRLGVRTYTAGITRDELIDVLATKIREA